MVIGIILLVIFLIFGILYYAFFKEYSIVIHTFEMLVKVIETRDLMLMRILPEIKNKGIKNDMSKMIAERIEAKKVGNDKLIEVDVKINKKLDKVYKELDKSNNPIVKEELKRILNLEQKLKTIRREYNKAVEAYNNKLVKHPKIMIKFWKLKPLNTYEFKENT